MAQSKVVAKWRGLTTLGALRQAVNEAVFDVLHGQTHQNADETYLICKGVHPGLDIYLVERVLSDGSVIQDIEIDSTDHESANTL
mgnify:CR=1 FL=1